MKTKINTLGIILLAMPAYTYAAPIDPLSISEASGCNVSSIVDCTVNWDSQIFMPTLDGETAAVQINRSSGSSWLIRYDLYGSHSGNIWLEASDVLDSTNNFNIFADQVDQPVYDPFYFGMTAADVLNGSASYHISGEPDYIESGNLNFFNSYMHICIECSAGITLNLNGLDYSTGALDIFSALFAPRTNPLLIISQDNPYGGDDYSGSSYTEEFYTSPVPVPAAVWLFGSGLLGLIGLMRRNRQRV